MRKVSKKQQQELYKRRKLLAKLIIESNGLCMTCGGTGGALGISLSHIIPLARGGETSEKNCLSECNEDHLKYEKHPERRPERR